MPRKTRRNGKGSNAIRLLTEDHAKVQKIFDKFERTRDEARKADMVDTALHELKVHTEIEEEIFYPAVRQAIADDELLDEALVEHDSAKHLIGELEGMRPGDELFDARFTVLGEYVKHHIREEQRQIFPLAKRAKMDLDQLGEQLLQRKRELGA